MDDPHSDAVVHGFRHVELPRIQVRSRVRTEGAMQDFARALSKCVERAERRHNDTHVCVETSQMNKNEANSATSEASTLDNVDRASSASNTPPPGTSHNSLQEISSALMRSLENQRSDSTTPDATAAFAPSMHALEVR